MGPSIKGVESN